MRLTATWWHPDQPAQPRTLDEPPSLAPPGGGSLVDDTGSIGQAGLASATARLAGALRTGGVRRGDTVAWQSANRWESVMLLRACWRLGAVAAPLHPRAGVGEVDAAARRLEPRLFVDPGDVPGLIEAGRPVGTALARPDDLAVVLHTSGSSGQPKGVLHTHAGLAYKARLMIGVHGLGPGDTVLMPAPLAHISGLQNGVTLPAAASMGVVLMARWDPEHALSLIERHRVTFMAGPPTFFVTMRDAPGFAPERVRSLRLISCGGSGVSADLVAETAAVFGAVVKRSYGSTEAPTVTTSHAGDDPVRARETDGRPTGAVRLRLGPGRELQVRGPELFVGYTDAAATAAAVSDGWFRTGDVGRVDDGWLTIEGRLGDLVIRGGENIAPAEVEAVLEAHPAVRQAAVVGEPDPRLGERLCAFVVPTPGASLDLAACRAWFAERGAARFKAPERIVVVDELPRLASGKVERAELRRRLGAGAAVTTATPPAAGRPGATGA